MQSENTSFINLAQHRLFEKMVEYGKQTATALHMVWSVCDHIAYKYIYTGIVSLVMNSRLSNFFYQKCFIFKFNLHRIVC